MDSCRFVIFNIVFQFFYDTLIDSKGMINILCYLGNYILEPWSFGYKFFSIWLIMVLFNHLQILHIIRRDYGINITSWTFKSLEVSILGVSSTFKLFDQIGTIAGCTSSVTISSDTFSSAWNCFKCLSLFDFLKKFFLHIGQILLSATELRCQFIAKHDLWCFTMLFLYLEVVLQLAVGQMNKDSSLLNSTLLFFCNQCPFNFSCLFRLNTVEKLLPQSYDTDKPFLFQYSSISTQTWNENLKKNLSG